MNTLLLHCRPGSKARSVPKSVSTPPSSKSPAMPRRGLTAPVPSSSAASPAAPRLMRRLRFADLIFPRQWARGDYLQLPETDRISVLLAHRRTTRCSSLWLEAGYQRWQGAFQLLPQVRGAAAQGAGQAGRLDEQGRAAPSAHVQERSRSIRRHRRGEQQCAVADGHPAPGFARTQPLDAQAGGGLAPFIPRAVGYAAGGGHDRRRSRRGAGRLDTAAGQPAYQGQRGGQRADERRPDGLRAGGTFSRRRLYLPPEKAGGLDGLRHRREAGAQCCAAGNLDRRGPVPRGGGEPRCR